MHFSFYDLVSRVFCRRTMSRDCLDSVGVGCIIQIFLCLLSSSRSSVELGNGIHLRMLRELADIMSKPLSCHLWKVMEIRGSPDDWKRTITPIYKKGIKARSETAEQSDSFQSLGKLQNRSFRKLLPCTWRKRRWFGKANRNILSCLTNLIVFSSETVCPVDMGRAVDVIYLDFYQGIWHSLPQYPSWQADKIQTG